jgi:hypothetical protein
LHLPDVFLAFAVNDAGDHLRRHPIVWPVEGEAADGIAAESLLGPLLQPLAKREA